MQNNVYRTCPLCEACCGIEVEVRDGRVEEIRGDPDDPASRGFLCPKARALKDVHEDPDRLRRPLLRQGETFRETSWSEALEAAARGLRAVRERHGETALALYQGEPLVHNLGAMLFVDELVAALGSPKRFSSNSLDQFPKQLACHWMYGSGLFVPVPDVDRTDHLLILGANPAVSNGSLLTAPGLRRRLRDLRRRGGRLVVVDPRRSETARAADEHHVVRPGTDALLLAAMIHTLFEEHRARLGRLAGFTVGLDDAARFVAAFPPERVAGRVGLAATTIRRLACDFAAARRAVAYGRMGTSVVPFGSVASWLVEVLNVVTGNLDREGGALFPQPAVDVMALQPPTRWGRWRSRTRGVPEFMGELPTATLAEEIETPGEGRVRGLVTLAGNPVLSSPAGHRLSRALEGLEFMVAVDLYCNETTRHADVILPPVDPLAREHYDLAFQLFAVRHVPRWSPAAVRPGRGERTDASIVLDLARRLHRGRGLRGRVRGWMAAGLLACGADRSVRGALDVALRTGPYGRGARPWGPGLSLGVLRRSAHGIDLGPLRPGLPARLPATSKTIELAPPELVGEQDRLDAWCEAAPPELVIVGRREVQTLNSWSHNWPSLAPREDRFALEIHPDDASPRGIADGDRVRVTSRVGSVTVRARVSRDLAPGVVCLPHGYGHGAPGARLRVASAQPGASLNDLTDPAELDPLCGNAVLSGTPVVVSRATG